MELDKHPLLLIIDDEPRMRLITQRILALNGFTVKMAGSGEEGLNLLLSAPVDAVILDVRMSGMDGIVVLKKIRDQYPTLPVIMVTQADEEQIRDEAERLGVKGYLMKPVNFDHLKQLLNSVTVIAKPANTKSQVSSANGSGSNGSLPKVPQP